MDTSIYPWQQQAWQQLQKLHTRLPHAILFHGGQGIGKLRLVEQFAQSLLCESLQPSGHACGTCAACGWFSQYSHPDYRRVRPEALEEGDVSEEPGAAEESATKKSGTASRNPSSEIRIDQVRSLTTFLNVSTHRSGLRVLLLYPAEALNSASANSLLKILEEPPPETIFLLITHRPERLLPTILSRCRKFAMGMPAEKDALAWLESEEVSDPQRWLAELGGAPLAARDAAKSGAAEGQDEVLAHFARPDRATALSVAERLQKTPLTSLVAWHQRWMYDMLLVKLCDKVRYYPRHQKTLTALAARVSADRLQQALRLAGQRRAVADHPLSARLFIEDMLLEYTQIFSHA